MVMGGAKPAYVANQLGHSLQVLYTTYARWIDGADKGGEASKLASILGEFGPNLAPTQDQDESHL
jgi:integrase